MIKIINTLLTNCGYRQNEILRLEGGITVHLFGCEKLYSKEEYFLTLQLERNSDIALRDLSESKGQEIFEKLLNSENVERYFAKNCTMVICISEELVDNRVALSVEEDAYNFKKNIIAFSQEEIDSLASYMAENKMQNLDRNVINSIINDKNGAEFLLFKNSNGKARNHYSLILKIIQKIPCLTYNPQAQQLNDLLLDFEQTLTPQLINTFREALNLNPNLPEKEFILGINEVWTKE